MYLSQQYLDIGGKFIENPFRDDECMYSVNLHEVMCELHTCGARHISDFQKVIVECVERETGQSNDEISIAILRRIIAKLGEKGVTPIVSEH